MPFSDQDNYSMEPHQINCIQDGRGGPERESPGRRGCREAARAPLLLLLLVRRGVGRRGKGMISAKGVGRRGRWLRIPAGIPMGEGNGSERDKAPLAHEGGNSIYKRESGFLFQHKAGQRP
jgi:hypothetical protein